MATAQQVVDRTPVGVRDVFESPVLNERRRKAIATLGRNWVLHPQYIPNPKHVFARLGGG